MIRDLRFALRMILAHRWFSAAVVATLAMGIGLNTMVFTLVNAALFKPVPLPGGERLVYVRGRNPAQATRRMAVSYPDFLEYKTHATSFEALEGAMWGQAILSERGNPPQSYNMNSVSPGLFDMLHTPPILGRGFQPSDGKAGAEPVILIGHGVWKNRYGGARDVIGRVVRLNAKPATIIGVMPEGFKFPQNLDVWTAMTPTADMDNRARRPVEVFGMLKPGKTIPEALTELQGIAKRIAVEYPATNKDVEPVVETFHEVQNGGTIRLVFLLLLGAVGCVLLIACANVANMMLSRAMGREREISIRAALGASRWQVVRQLLIECVVLSTLGGVLGLGLAALGVHLFDLATRDVGKPYWILFEMDYTVFGYFAALCVLSGLLFGLVPALRISRVDINSALKDGTRSAGTRRGGRLAGGLVVVQIALTLVLLTGASVFARGFLDSLSLNSWVPEEQILTARINLPRERYKDKDARIRFFEQALPGLRAIPGVTHVALVSNPPGMGAGQRRIEVEQSPVANPAQGPQASVVVQWPGYFSAVGLPMLLGRDFNDADGGPGQMSAVVTKEFAERHWAKEGALGKRFRFYTNEKPGEWITVTGVSANVVQESSKVTQEPVLFLPYRQEGYDSMALLVRSGASPASLTSGVRGALQSLDQDLPLSDVRTMIEAKKRQRWHLVVFGSLFLFFALMALVIASVGIYAVIAQAAARRTQEIGVRMALGATAQNILRLVLLRGVWQLGAGLVLGLAAAVPAARVMSTLPLRVSTRDPWMFVAVGLVLTAVGLVACWIPARRAAGLDPVNAIRYE